MSIVAIHHWDENNFMHFFVVKEFTGDGTVTGKFLRPNTEEFMYRFDPEDQIVSLHEFEHGFDMVYEGECFGGIDYKSMPSLIIPNPHMPRKFQ